MHSSILSPEKDPMGAAIADYYTHEQADKLRVFSSQFDEDEIPVDQLFRSYSEMSAVEQKALQLAKGSILDVGAGSGCHTLALQEMGKEAVAIDISPLSVEVMKQRGVKSAQLINLFDPALTTQYDTLLMLMNGAGIVGVLDNLPLFFTRIKELLRPGGTVLLDSSDLRYLFEEEDGSFLVDLAADYYGQVDFTMQYKEVKGETFDWLYVDFETLNHYAAEAGFEATLVQEGEHYDYLAQLRVKK